MLYHVIFYVRPDRPSIPRTSLHLETFPRHITRTSLPLRSHHHSPHWSPNSAPEGVPISGIKSSRYLFFAAPKDISADACRKSTPRHPAAQRQFSKD